MVTRPGVAAGLEFEPAFPEIGEAVFDLVDKALLVVGSAVAASAVIADRLQLQLAGLGVGKLNLEIGESR